VTSTLIANARVLTLGGVPAPRRGRTLADLAPINRADVLIHNAVVAEITASSAPASALRRSLGDNLQAIDARGRVLMPAFVDCHTHLCHAGSRVAEWERVLAGETYHQIAASGGGIMSTVRATRHASQGELACDLIGRADRALALGTTTVEVKTGYGLTLDHELKMLAAIHQAAAYSSATIVPTALLGHAIDPDFPGESDDFVNHVIRDILPAFSAKAPGCAVDAFCERSAWSVPQCLELFRAAKAAGHPIRVHADQFTSLGMVGEAIRLGARSVDHLEATLPDDIDHLGMSNTFAVILPCCGFHLDGRYAYARGLADKGAALAIATNSNPGSAPCLSMPMAIALAVRFGKLTPSEAIAAATINPALVLGFTDRGYLAPNCRADLLLLHDTDERALAYEFGSSPIDLVFAAGKVVNA
jgi:imidazolonepropionase